MIPNLDVLGSLVRDLHQGLSQLFYLLLPVAILLSVILSQIQTGCSNAPDVIRRALIAALLLAAFPEISNVILDVCDGIAGKIDDMSGLEAFTRMASEKLKGYSVAKHVLLLQFDDLFMAILSFLSFVLVFVARYLTVALYYFYWTLLSICSPLMILCYVFPATARITGNLFRGLIEVAAWKILWAVMSAMLKSVAFGEIYKVDGSYLTLMILNFVIAIGLISTPMLMKSLIGPGIESSAQTIGTAAAVTMVGLPARAAFAQSKISEVVTTSRRFAVHKFNSAFRSNENKGGPN